MFKCTYVEIAVIKEKYNYKRARHMKVELT